MLDPVLVIERGQTVAGRVRLVAALAVALVVTAAIMTVAGPGGNPRAAAWPTVGLAVLAAAWLAGVLALGRAREGIRQVPRPWRSGYYAGLLVLLTALVAWSPWFMLVSWTAFVYAFMLFEARWGFFGAAVGGVALTAAQARSLVPSSPETLPLYVLSVVAPLLAGGWYLGRESSARRRLIGELTDANAALRAASAANARLRQQLVGQAQQAGVEQERQRMAREIHDTLAQDLSAVVAQLEVALAAAGQGHQWRRPVTQARDVARDGLGEVRRLVQALASPLLEGAALPGALRVLARRWQLQTGIEAACHSDGDVPPLPEEVQAALLRVAQAALANVAEHAGASRAQLTLSWVDEAVLLDVWDNGRGFEPSQVQSRPGDSAGERGFGLSGMRQRLGQLGGRLEIESTPGHGTAICARVPVAQAGASGART
jgi:signal transduction histidine kinase